MSSSHDQNSKFNRDEIRRSHQSASRTEEQQLICLLSSGTKVKPGLFDTRVICEFDEQTTRKKLLLLNLN